jgi:hypothetical protein
MFTVQYIAQMKIVFIHPDFGIGGAERLVLDAAIALRERKHSIQIVTNQFSEKHCFKELLEFKQSTLFIVNRERNFIINATFQTSKLSRRGYLSIFLECFMHFLLISRWL